MPATGPGSTSLDLRVGDVVEVRSPEEIRATLDENGELESLPFMPEMLKYCGRRMTVQKVAHKACDTLTRGGIRRMENAVHLTGARCDGAGHGGCQAACLIYWKNAWLRKVEPAAAGRGRRGTVPVPGHRAAARGAAAAAPAGPEPVRAGRAYRQRGPVVVGPRVPRRAVQPPAGRRRPVPAQVAAHPRRPALGLPARHRQEDPDRAHRPAPR